jgi:hypothetical protein
VHEINKKNVTDKANSEITKHLLYRQSQYRITQNQKLENLMDISYTHAKAMTLYSEFPRSDPIEF